MITFWGWPVGAEASAWLALSCAAGADAAEAGAGTV
jgi:hypothetical protein